MKMQVNLLRLAQKVGNQLSNQSLKQYKEIETLGGLCFYCSTSSEADDVKEKLKDAFICPHCGIDSLVPRKVLIELSPEMISFMNLFSFQMAHRYDANGKESEVLLFDIINDGDEDES